MDEVKLVRVSRSAFDIFGYQITDKALHLTKW